MMHWTVPSNNEALIFPQRYSMLHYKAQQPSHDVLQTHTIVYTDGCNLHAVYDRHRQLTQWVALVDACRMLCMTRRTQLTQWVVLVDACRMLCMTWPITRDAGSAQVVQAPSATAATVAFGTLR